MIILYHLLSEIFSFNKLLFKVIDNGIINLELEFENLLAHLISLSTFLYLKSLLTVLLSI